MAVYRKMDVGTAKPTLEERGGVPHHMLDVVDASEQFSVVEYMRQAAEAVRGIRERGAIALFVGGTPRPTRGCAGSCAQSRRKKGLTRSGAYCARKIRNRRCGCIRTT